MFFSLYRRRHRITLIIVLAIILILLFYIPKTENNFEDKEEFYVAVENKISNTHKKMEATKSVRKQKNRVNINNYVPPLPCLGCPGENGVGVNLTVSFKTNVSSNFLKVNLKKRLKK
jgi:hypothetical protein